MHKSNKKKFFDLPEYPGGKDAYLKFMEGNLRYPQEAIDKGIEGAVQVNYRVDSEGNVRDIQLEKGIGFGCDEEALRLVSLLKYGNVKNPGYKVTSTFKTRITFKLPMQQIHINYQITETKDKGTKLNYTIQL